MARPKDHELDFVFRPQTIAVIGASRDPGSVGHQVLKNIVDSGFQGAVFPVNPKADYVHAIKCYASVRDVPDEVDLALICVPTDIVQTVAHECGEEGVKALCVITAGFREIGPAGAERERELRDYCRANGMRLVGPNCMGVMNAQADVRMDATIGPSVPRPGPVAFLSQSGAMGVSIIDHAVDLGLGISMFASIGNRADVSGNDLLAYWEHDDRTQIVLMYLESFGNPRTFIPLARRMSRKKPILCVKAGRTAEAAEAATSHTGALAGADVAVDALLEQTGVLRVNTVRELFDVAHALSSQPLPKGKRVGILTNAGGPAILAVDFLVGSGLELAQLSEKTKERLRDVLVPEASVANPVDMVAGAGSIEYQAALPLILDDPGVDMVLTIFVPPVHVDPLSVASTIIREARRASKPVFGCFMAREEVVEAMTKGQQESFPVYAYPEEAVRAMRHLVRVRALRDDDPGEIEVFSDIDHEQIADIVDTAMSPDEAASPGMDRFGAPMVSAPNIQKRGRWLSADEVWRLMNAAGIPAVHSTMTEDIEEVVEVASSLGTPVALKLDGEAFLHKSDLGAVALGLEGEDTVRGAAVRLGNLAQKTAPDQPYRFVVQPMIKGGVEVLLGSRTDPVFGPVLMAGLGGIHVEIMKDVAFGVVPLTRPLAERMLRRLRSFPVLEGARGGEVVDLDALETVLLRLAAVVENHDEILEFEMNPLIARSSGAVAIDARIRVGVPFRPE
jgi:acetyl coenzyme A synthetase (ADP forming)-like protein